MIAGNDTQEIGGRSFTFGMMAARESFRFQLKLLRILGEPLAQALAGVLGVKVAQGSSKEAMFAAAVAALRSNPAQLVAAIRALAERMEPEEVEAMADKLLASVVHSGNGKDPRPVKMDEFFTSPGDLWKVLAGAMKRNFADFFSALDSSSSQGEIASPSSPSEA